MLNNNQNHISPTFFMINHYIIICKLAQTEADVRQCLTEARIPSFNKERIDLKPAITVRHLQFFLHHTFFFLLKLGAQASLRHIVCHHLNVSHSQLEATEDTILISTQDNQIPEMYCPSEYPYSVGVLENQSCVSLLLPAAEKCRLSHQQREALSRGRLHRLHRC